jgi:hypothetical protein
MNDSLQFSLTVFIALMIGIGVVLGGFLATLLYFLGG